MHDGWTFAHAADHALAIDAAEQTVEHRIIALVLADDRVLDHQRDTVVDETGDGVERLLLIGAESIFGLQVEDERHARGVGNFANAGFHTAGIAWITAGQHHRRAKGMTTEDARLIHRAAI